jgi:hypothetical protein
MAPRPGNPDVDGVPGGRMIAISREKSAGKAAMTAPMDATYERMITRAATIDELLSAGPGEEHDPSLAERRLAAWCRASANGDSELFRRRLARDGLSCEDVLGRLATLRLSAPERHPAWIDDAVWVETALQNDTSRQTAPAPGIDPRPFEQLLRPMVEEAETRLWGEDRTGLRGHFTDSGHACLRLMLLDQLSDLCAPPLYERFAAMRSAADTGHRTVDRQAGASLYDRFVADMKSGGFRDLFEEKPVLLRLISTLVRQWIDTIREFASRLDADVTIVRRDLAGRDGQARVAKIDGGLSDRHNDGRSVLVVTFEDGTRVVYKPKDLRSMSPGMI